MNKKITTIIVLVISILLVSLYVISSTYSVIIDVIEKDGKSEIINNITIRDLVTDDNGMYNSTYYDAINELDITEDDANVLMDSVPLNRVLDVILNSIVEYNLHNKNKISNDELYNLITEAINEDNTINETLKNKAINKTRIYINDISDYMYDIKMTKHEENA